LQTCWSCGNSYSGYDCPFCANKKALEEHAERIAQEQEESREAFQAAQEESREAFQSALDEHENFMAGQLQSNAQAMEDAVARYAEEQRRSVEEHKRIVANAPKIQAEEKVAGARRLLVGGLTQQALSMAEDAMRLDPENLDAVLVAAETLRRVRRSPSEIKPYYERQVKLLATPSYSRAPSRFLDVLEDLPADEGLVGDFVYVVTRNIQHWNWQSLQQAEKLLARLKSYDPKLDTRFFLEWQMNTLKNEIEWHGWSAEHFKKAKEITAAARIVGMQEAARQFASAVAGKAKGLIDHAFAADLCAANGLDNSKALMGHIQTLTLASGAEASLVTLKKLAGEAVISPDIASRIHVAVAERYSAWKEDIRGAIYERVMEEVKGVSLDGPGKAVAIVSFIVLSVVGGLTSGPSQPAYWGAILSFGALFGMMLMAGLSDGVTRRFRMQRKAISLLERAFAGRNAELEAAGLPEVTPRRYPGSASAFTVISIVAVSVYLFAWLALLHGGAGVTVSSGTPSTVRPSPHGPSTAHNSGAMIDEMMGSSLGNATGVSWTKAMGSHGAQFSAANSSRIEYAGKIPGQGTLEFWINVQSGYGYDNGVFKQNQDFAVIFSTDALGGDVAWPGATKFFVTNGGNISLWMATSKYDRPAAVATEARNTAFRFGEWHALGFSYGKDGQFIMLDGSIVASAPGSTQRMGSAGTHAAPVDLPTIGETVSHAWAHHQYEGGFEGTVARFRASARQKDWVLARGVVEER
jgi:hypothetical protein